MTKTQVSWCVVLFLMMQINGLVSARLVTAPSASVPVAAKDGPQPAAANDNENKKNASSYPTTHTLEGSLPMRVNPETQRLVDGYGREVYFHGVNVVCKNPPYLPLTQEWNYENSVSQKDLHAMEDLGLNSIRLGAMWIGIEPEEGVYNETYLAHLANLTRWAGEDFGVYSLWDSHQDIAGPKYCGDGMPLWTMNAHPDLVHTFPEPFSSPPYHLQNGTHLPSHDDCWGNHNISTWAEYYFTYASASAAGRFWKNHNGWLDRWNSMWGKLAGLGSTLGSSLLGYELMNEPFAGNLWENISIVLPTHADITNLQPAYDNVSANFIYPQDSQKHAVFFEGVTWDWFGVGFGHVPGGDQFRNHSVLSYHYYAPPDFNLLLDFEMRKDDMARLQCGGFLTEFSFGSTTTTPQDVMSKCEQFHQSWTGWVYKDGGPVTPPTPTTESRRAGEKKEMIDDDVAPTMTTFTPTEEVMAAVNKAKAGFAKSRQPGRLDFDKATSGLTDATFWNRNGTINPHAASIVARTYVRVVPGNLLSQHFNTSTSDYTMVFKVTSDFKSYAVAKIYASEEYNYGGKPAVVSAARQRGGGGGGGAHSAAESDMAKDAQHMTVDNFSAKYMSGGSSGTHAARVAKNHYFVFLDMDKVHVGDQVAVTLKKSSSHGYQK